MEVLAAIWLGILTFFGQAPGPSPDLLVSPTVFVKQGTSHGSGVFIAPNKILTADHVVEDNKVSIVALDERRRGYKVTHVERSKTIDLAILTVTRDYEGWLPEVSCRAPERGIKVATVGNPLNMRFVYNELNVTGGHYLPYTAEEGVTMFAGVSNPGQSGSPIYHDGTLIGILTLVMKDDEKIEISKKKSITISSSTGIGGFVSFESDCGFIKGHALK